MTPSSKLSTRRGTAGTPGICKPPPPPPPPPPAPDLWTTCDVMPDEDEMEPGNDQLVTLFCDQENLEAGTPVPVDCVASDGTWTTPATVDSDQAGDPSEYTAPDEEGTVTLTATFHFPNGQTCIASAEIEIEEII